jgi:hypothetical protein
VVVEMMITKPNQPSAATTYDMVMLATFEGGRIRTETELRRLLASAGLTLTNVIPTPPTPNIIIESVRDS